MRTVVRTQEGVLELNYLWLPTWIGMNSKLKVELEHALKDSVVGLTMSEDDLDRIDCLVIGFLVERNPGVAGLRDLLEGLKFVNYQ